MQKIFGNWIVNSKGITWDERFDGKYHIPFDKGYLHTIKIGDVIVYDWLVHMDQKTWISNYDLNNLNEAFRFLAKHHGLIIDAEIYNNSLSYQRKN